MNKVGKSNIVFIVLIPVFIFITLVVVDTIISYSVNKKFKNVTEKIIAEVMNNEEIDYEEYYNEIKRMYSSYNYDVDMLVVDADDYKVRVDNEFSYFNLFSSLKNTNAKPMKVSILGTEFNVRKGSKAIISVEATYDSNDELVFEYVE